MPPRRQRKVSITAHHQARQVTWAATRMRPGREITMSDVSPSVSQHGTIHGYNNKCTTPKQRPVISACIPNFTARPTLPSGKSPHGHAQHFAQIGGEAKKPPRRWCEKWIPRPLSSPLDPTVAPCLERRARGPLQKLSFVANQYNG